MNGIRPSVVAAVFRAELLSVVRDRWTIAVSVLLPLLLYPTVGIGLSTVVARSVGTLQAQVARVCIEGGAADVGRFAAAFGKEEPPKTEVVECPEGPEAHLGKDLDALVRLPEDVSATLERHEKVTVRVFYNSTEARGAMANDRVRKALTEEAESIVSGRIRDGGLSESFASPIAVVREDVAPPQKSEMFTWVPVVVLFLILLSVLGVFLPSIDLTAGDRERNTLETLMTSPARASELIGGKFCVVLALGLVSTGLNVGSLFGTVALMGSGVPGISMPVSVPVALSIGLVSIPTVALSAAICITVGCLARSFRDAQNYMTPVYLAVILPAYAAALPTAKLTTFTAAVPLLNLPLILKGILTGDLVASHLWIATLVTLAFGAATLLLAAKLYGHEGIAFSDAEPVDLLRRSSTATLRFTAGEGIALFAATAATFFYLGTPITQRFGVNGVFFTLVLCVLGPSVLYAFWRRLEWRTAFAFRRPKSGVVLGAVLLGLGLWAPLGLFHALVQEPFFPTPPELEQAMRDLLLASDLGWPALILIAAVAPAVCEEVLFRGALLQSFRPALGRGAVVASALLFALLHMSPWRFAPTFFLGLVLGALVLRTGSIWPAIALHFVHNATVVTLAVLGGGEAAGGDVLQVPRFVWILPVLALAAGIQLVFAPIRRREAPPAADGKGIGT